MLERALIVDDDPALQRALAREVLKGFEVVLAGRADEAIDIISRDPQLRAVVSDLDLGPGRNGLHVLRHARKVLPDAARLLVTGEISEEDAGEALATGAAHYVFIKPWDRGELIKALQRVLAGELEAEEYSPTQSHVRSRRNRIILSATMRQLGP
jgi:DNA-binding NtrC family response regulator